MLKNKLHHWNHLSNYYILWVLLVLFFNEIAKKKYRIVEIRIYMKAYGTELNLFSMIYPENYSAKLNLLCKMIEIYGIFLAIFNFYLQAMDNKKNWISSILVFGRDNF